MKTVRAADNRQILYSVCLQKPGTVLVRTGDEINRGDSIAETRLPERFLVYDVVNQLKLPPNAVDRHIHRLVGESFVAGDVIAQKPGLFSRIFRARQDGKVVSIRDGKVVLALGQAVETIAAPFPGVITEIIHEQGAVIETFGAVTEGVLGGSGSAVGELTFSKLGLDDRKRLEDETSFTGKICYCESLEHVQQLKAVLQADLAGLVLGSISARVYERLRGSTLPWLLLGGFGTFELNGKTRAVLESMKGQTVYLLGNHSDQPPTLLCPKHQENQAQDRLNHQASQALKVGAKVRLWGQPYQGRNGEIIELPREFEPSACGESILPVVVKLTEELTVRVPIENLVIVSD